MRPGNGCRGGGGDVEQNFSLGLSGQAAATAEGADDAAQKIDLGIEDDPVHGDLLAPDAITADDGRLYLPERQCREADGTQRARSITLINRWNSMLPRTRPPLTIRCWSQAAFSAVT